MTSAARAKSQPGVCGGGGVRVRVRAASVWDREIAFYLCVSIWLQSGVCEIHILKRASTLLRAKRELTFRENAVRSFK